MAIEYSVWIAAWSCFTRFSVRRSSTVRPPAHQPQLVLKRFLGGGLELSPRVVPRRAQILSAARISSTRS